MRFPFKQYPRAEPHPAFPDERWEWRPVLPIQLSYRGGPLTQRFEALVDSGSDDCLFAADIATRLGIRLHRGVYAYIAGITAGIDVYYHEVDIVIAKERYAMVAGFSNQLSAASGPILGRHGFFDRHAVTFEMRGATPVLLVE